MRDTGTESLYLLLESFDLENHLEVQDGLACLWRQGDRCDGPNVVGHGVANLRSIKIMMMSAMCIHFDREYDSTHLHFCVSSKAPEDGVDQALGHILLHLHTEVKA